MSAALQAFLGMLLLSLVVRGANGRRRGAPLWHIAARAVGSGVAAWLLIGAGMSMVPPLADLRVQVIEQGPGMLVLAVHGTRNGQCRFDGNDAFVYTLDGTVHGAAVQYRGPGAGVNRLPGRHRFSDRALYFRAEVDPVAVRFVAHHDCGLLWRDIRSDSGRLELWQ